MFKFYNESIEHMGIIKRKQMTFEYDIWLILYPIAL